MNDRGTVDLPLLLVLLGATLIPATIAVGPPLWLDTLAGSIVLYGAAVTVSVATWRYVRRRQVLVMRAVHVILGLDARVDRIEKHLGIKPDG